MEHRKSKTPHEGCAVHEEILKSVNSSLDDIKSTLKVMDERVYDIFTNGRKKSKD